MEKPRHFSECPGGDNWTPSNSIIHVAMSPQPMLCKVTVAQRLGNREFQTISTQTHVGHVARSQEYNLWLHVTRRFA